ncbi:MAG: hypothetical protein QXI33_03100 [Candidatus Pacearchaeota archaeon]
MKNRKNQQRLGNKTLFIFLTIILVMSLWGVGVFAEEVDSNIGSNTRSFKLVELSLDPEKQKASLMEEVFFTIIVKDTRETKDLLPKTYFLSFSTAYPETSIRLDGNQEVTLNHRGDYKKVGLIVRSKKIGTNPFKVVVKDLEENLVDVVQGSLFVVEGEEEIPSRSYSDGNEIISDKEIKKEIKSGFSSYIDNEEEILDSSYFIGEGFVLSEDETEGSAIRLHILKSDNEVKGKFYTDKGVFFIKGNINEEDKTLGFKVFDKDESEKAKFSGSMKFYGNFLLLRGKVTESNGENVWNLIAFSQNKNVIKPIIVDKGDFVKSSVKINEVVSFEKNISKKFNNNVEEIETNLETEYIQPVQVYEKKILWIFPTGKKVLEVKTFFDDGSQKIVRIEEYSDKKIGKYNVEVGSLDDTSNIELKVKLAE